MVAVLLIAILIAPGFSASDSKLVLAAATETSYIANSSGLSGDDAASGQLPIGFDFSFYGQNQQNVFLTTNGVLNFATGGLGANNEYGNNSLNVAGRKHSIYPFWDDLVTNGINKIRYATVGESPNRKFLSQWTNMYFYGQSEQMGTFQVVLYETSNIIQIQFRDIIGDGRSQGNSATIGIKGNNDSQVSQYKSNTDRPEINSGTVITYTPSSLTDTTSYTVSTDKSYDPIFLSVAGSPTVSALTSPVDGATQVSTTPTLQWSTSTSATSYKLMVATNPSFSNYVSGFPKTLDENGNTAFTLTNSLSHSTTYYWRVIAINSIGEVSSSVSRFTTQAPNALPNAISDVSGDLRNGVEVRANALKNKILTFDVRDSDQEQKVRYQAQISQNANFSTLTIDYRSGIGSQGSYTFRIGADTGTYLTGSKETEFLAGSYYLRIRAEDELGAQSAWIEFGSPSFVVPALLPPTKPLNLSATISDDKVTMKWMSPQDLVVDDSNIYIGSLKAGLEVLTCETRNLECVITGVRKNIAYEASVIAKNAAGNSPISNTATVFVPEIVEVIQGNKIPLTFEPSARRLGLSPLATSSQLQLVKVGVVDAPATTTTIAVSNDLSNNKFDIETLANNLRTIDAGTAIGLQLTPPSDTPAGTVSYAYLKSPDGEWILLGSAPAVAGVSTSLPAMSFVFPGAYEVLWTLKAPANYQPLGILSFAEGRIFNAAFVPELGIHTLRLAVTVEKGSAELPTLASATPMPSPTETLVTAEPTPAPTEVLETSVSPEPTPSEAPETLVTAEPTPVPTEVPETPASPEPTDTTTEATESPANGEVVAFNPLDDPAGVASTAVTALALAAAAGAAGARSGGSSSSNESNSEESGGGGSLSTIDVNLVGHESEELGTGDRFKIFALPLLNFFDRPSHDAGVRTSKYSPLISRLIVDGAYLRAMFGSVSLIATLFTIGLGAVSAFNLDGAVLPPPALVLGVIAVIGVFDALSGFLGMSMFAVTALVLADERTVGDIRILMGLILIGFGPVLLADGARNFRGETRYSGEHIWDRITDVAIGTFLAGWSALAMVSVLPALAGLTLPIGDSATSIGLAVAIAIAIRIALEAVAARFFPARLNNLHPTNLDDSPLVQKMIALALRAGLFFFVAAAFIGYEWYLFVGTLLFIIPSYLGLFADKVPNNPTLYQIIPAGIPGLIFSLAIGALTVGVVTSFFGEDPLLAKLSFVLVPIPLFIVALLGLVGREPRENDVRWYERDNFKLLYRIGGAVAFVTVLKMTGILS
jgi:hypothetical protein